LNYSIVIIGSGNVATHLSHSLSNAGYSIVQVFSRKTENAMQLAARFNCMATDKVSEIITNADLYIISISDTAVGALVDSLNFEPNRIIHTAGSLDISLLSRFKNCGVLYPLQTFSKERTIEFKDVPLCIEASNKEFEIELHTIALQLSTNVHMLNSAQRRECHMAAIFANNFTNHFYNIAAEMLKKKDIPFSILQPLIKETAAKIEQMHPAQAQTGPAARGDRNVVNKHIELLQGTGLEKIYSFVSESIIKSRQ